MDNMNSYFEHIAKEQNRYASGNFPFNPKYMEHKTNNSPYKIPYEYGKNGLNTFEDKTNPAIRNNKIPVVQSLSKKKDEILYVK